MKIEPGQVVVIVLQNPRERILAVLDEVTPAGLFVRCVDLDYFDSWVNAIKNDEPYLSMHDNFYPMWRVERMSRDEPSGGVPALWEQFEQRTGKRLSEF